MPYATTSQIRIYYQRQGEGCPVLFIPGVAGDLRVKPNIFDSELAHRFDILSFDQRGTGQSDKPDIEYTLQHYVEDAQSLMDRVGWQSAHVIGVSFGGMVAQELALTTPHRVRSLTLCCTTSGGAGGSSYPIHKLSGLSAEALSRRLLALWDTRYDEAWQAQHPDETAQMLATTIAAAPFMKEPGGSIGFTRQIEARKYHNCYDRLPSLRLPTLVCGGKYDGWAKPEAVKRLHAQIAGAELAFFDGGHRFLDQDPDALLFIAQTLERFCTDTSS
ncbi:MAG: alpha/beta fold hydrolase [Candidatus Thiodiazotropha sp.]